MIQNRRKPRLVIEKLDFDTQEPMKGTKFAVCRETTIIGEFTTDRDGLIELEDIEPGTYTVKEVATDSDHIVQGCPMLTVPLLVLNIEFCYCILLFVMIY